MTPEFDPLAVADRLRRLGGDAYLGWLRSELAAESRLRGGQGFDRRFRIAVRVLLADGKVRAVTECDGAVLVVLVETP
jgi:hypothetical protein